jgi:uncharacterized small protein (DUF1192 family)
LARALIDFCARSVNILAMDLDDLFAKRPGDPLILLTRQDLDPLSVTELQERIDILHGEIARVKAKMDGAINFRANADSLFNR